MADRRPTVSRGPLDAAELALAAVMAGLTVVIAIVGSLVPHAGPIAVLGAVPLAIVSQRTRLRALVASAFAAAAVGFIVAGLGPVRGGRRVRHGRRSRGRPQTATAAGHRGSLPPPSSWRRPSAPLRSGCLRPSLLRPLTLDQVQIATKGTLPGSFGDVSLGSVATWWTHVVDVMLAHWWLTVGLLIAVGVAWAMATAWICLGGVLTRLAWVSTANRLALAASEPGTRSQHVAPLPLHLSGACYRYPGADHNTLRDRPDHRARRARCRRGPERIGESDAGPPAGRCSPDDRPGQPRRVDRSRPARWCRVRRPAARDPDPRRSGRRRRHVGTARVR